MFIRGVAIGGQRFSIMFISGAAAGGKISHIFLKDLQ